MTSFASATFPSMFELLSQAATTHPHRIALAMASGRDGRDRSAFSHVSFYRLWRFSNEYAHGLQRLGVGPDDRVVILVPPEFDGIAMTYAVMALGATAVFIDPGMTPRTMATCIAEAKPTVMLGIDRAHMLRLLSPRAFCSVRIFVGERPWGFPRTVPFSGARLDSRLPFSQHPVSDRSTCAVVFTSGSTGPPKGVELSHRNFTAIRQAVDSILFEVEGLTDLVTLPLFAFISCTRGRTSVLPAMDFACPGACDPARIVEAMETYRVAGGFGSPALWTRVNEYCRNRGITLPFVQALVSAGAPVPIRLIEQFSELFPYSRIFTPYGATEVLPITNVDSRELLDDVRDLTATGHGYCVGRPVPGIQARIIRTVDEPLADWRSARELPAGEVGEICAAGENVTVRYLSRPAETVASKIADPTVPGGFWHRTGDLGYFDKKGRLWYCGRKKHRFRLNDREIRPVQLEGVFMDMPEVFRCAVVKVNRADGPRLALVVEPAGGHRDIRSLRAIPTAAAAFAADHSIVLRPEDVFIHSDPLPVDRRHNAKINLEALTVWAQQKAKGRCAWINLSRSIRAAEYSVGWG